MKFSEKLKITMERLNLSQVQVVGLTGCSKASISQYLSGRNTPSEEKQKMIAVALGLAENYFEQFSAEDVKIKQIKAGGINRLSTVDAAKILGVDKDTVRKGLQQGVFPWGYGIQTSDKWTYIINARRFAEIEGVEINPEMVV